MQFLYFKNCDRTLSVINSNYCFQKECWTSSPAGVRYIFLSTKKHSPWLPSLVGNFYQNFPLPTSWMKCKNSRHLCRWVFVEKFGSHHDPFLWVETLLTKNFDQHPQFCTNSSEKNKSLFWQIVVLLVIIIFDLRFAVDPMKG